MSTHKRTSSTVRSPEGLARRSRAVAFLGVALLATSVGCVGAGEARGTHSELAYGSAEEAVSAERRLLSLSQPSTRYRRLQELADWWFHCGGKYVDHNPYLDMIRVLRRMAEIDPGDVETITDIFYYSVSVEVDELVKGRQHDFTLLPLREIKGCEPANQDDLRFYLQTMPVLQLVFRHPEFGSPATKRAYYRTHRAFLEKAERLAPTAAADPDLVAVRLRVARKVAARYGHLAD